MRNLEILSRAIDTLKELNPGEEITRHCIDELSLVLFVYTSAHRLLKFSFKDVASQQVSLQRDVTMSDENPYLEQSNVVNMEYVQELMGVQITYASVNMYLVTKSKVEEVGEIPSGILAASWAPN